MSQAVFISMTLWIDNCSEFLNLTSKKELIKLWPSNCKDIRHWLSIVQTHEVCRPMRNLTEPPQKVHGLTVWHSGALIAPAREQECGGSK